MGFTHVSSKHSGISSNEVKVRRLQELLHLKMWPIDCRPKHHPHKQFPSHPICKFKKTHLFLSYCNWSFVAANTGGCVPRGGGCTSTIQCNNGRDGYRCQNGRCCQLPNTRSASNSNVEKGKLQKILYNFLTFFIIYIYLFQSARKEIHSGLAMSQLQHAPGVNARRRDFVVKINSMVNFFIHNLIA